MKTSPSEIAVCLNLAMTLLLWQGAVVQLVVAVALRWKGSSSLGRYQFLMAALVLLLVTFVVTFICLYQWDNYSSQRRWHVINLLAPYVTVIYLAGIVVMVTRIGFAILFGQHLRRASHAVSNPQLMQTVGDVAKALGLSNSPLVADCRLVSVPMVIGVLKPVILLPAYLTDKVTLDQLRTIITHELVHVRRRDHLVILVQRLIEALLFFHPVVWNISLSISAEREHACDDAVIASGSRPATYMKSLLRVGELQTLRSDSGLIACEFTHATSRSHRILRRITRLIPNQSESP